MRVKLTIENENVKSMNVGKTFNYAAILSLFFSCKIYSLNTNGVNYL